MKSSTYTFVTIVYFMLSTKRCAVFQIKKALICSFGFDVSSILDKPSLGKKRVNSLSCFMSKKSLMFGTQNTQIYLLPEKHLLFFSRNLPNFQQILAGLYTQF